MMVTPGCFIPLCHSHGDGTHAAIILHGNYNRADRRREEQANMDLPYLSLSCNEEGEKKKRKKKRFFLRDMIAQAGNRVPIIYLRAISIAK